MSYKDHILEVLGALKEECVERSLIPPAVKKFFEGIYLYGNPWRELRDNRGQWAEGTGVRKYQPGDEFLYYVGCIGSYDARGIEVARALGEVLLRSGLSFGIFRFLNRQAGMFARLKRACCEYVCSLYP